MLIQWFLCFANSLTCSFYYYFRLTTMAVRYGANFPELFKIIHTSRFLGKCQNDNLEMSLQMSPGAKSVRTQIT